MIYCDECADRYGWSKSPFKSYGACERCGNRRQLNDPPRPRPSTDELLGIAPDWCGDMSVDEYIDNVRRD